VLKRSLTRVFSAKFTIFHVKTPPEKLCQNHQIYETFLLFFNEKRY